MWWTQILGMEVLFSQWGIAIHRPNYLFLLGTVVGIGFFCSHCVSIKISMCSQHIPPILCVFLNMFPIAAPHNVTPANPTNIVLHPIGSLLLSGRNLPSSQGWEGWWGLLLGVWWYHASIQCSLLPGMKNSQLTLALCSFLWIRQTKNLLLRS